MERPLQWAASDRSINLLGASLRSDGSAGCVATMAALIASWQRQMSARIIPGDIATEVCDCGPSSAPGNHVAEARQRPGEREARVGSSALLEARAALLHLDTTRTSDRALIAAQSVVQGFHRLTYDPLGRTPDEVARGGPGGMHE